MSCVGALLAVILLLDKVDARAGLFVGRVLTRHAARETAQRHIPS